MILFPDLVNKYVFCADLVLSAETTYVCIVNIVSKCACQMIHAVPEYKLSHFDH